MSQHGTPQMGHLTKDGKLDSSFAISDSQAANAKQLLNAYIYDFLVKSRLPQTARLFVNEADIPSTLDTPGNGSGHNSPHINSNGPNNPKNLGPVPQSPTVQQFFWDHKLPISRVAIDAPQGFLFEWWQVFWDVYQAKNNRGNSQLANQYYQLQLLKQRQQQDLQGSNMNQPQNVNPQFNNFQQMHPNQPQPHPQPQGLPQGPRQIQPHPQQQQQQQQQPQGMDQHQHQQRLMMQLMMKQQQQQQHGFNQLDPQQQQHMIANMAGANPNNLTVQQQMFMLQQSQQGQNRFQQHAQNQMNNLRQQAAVRQGEGGSPPRQPEGTGPAPNQGPDQTPQGQPGQPGQTPMNGMFQQQPNMMNGGPGSQAPTPYQQPGPNPMQAQGQQGQQGQQPVNGAVMRVNNMGNGPGKDMNNQNGNSANNPPANGNMPPNQPNNNRNINALQDYQMQLMLLEKQNKKRLDIARNSGSADPNGLASLTAGMLPPQQHQMQQMQQSQQMSSQAQAQVQAQVQAQAAQAAQAQAQAQAQAAQAAQAHSQPSSVGQTPQSNPTKPSPAMGSGPSPVIGNKPSPGATKKKKETTAKRGRKPSVASQNNTNTVNGNNNGTPSNSAATPSHLKKEITTPLSPTSETPNDTQNKRKRKGSNAVGDSPKRTGGKNNKKDNLSINADTIKEEKEDGSHRQEEALNAMAPPSAISSNFQDIDSNDQMFTMDVLDHSHDDQLFDSAQVHAGGPHGNSNMNLNMNMGNNAHGGLDDIDFDFNSFLDGNVNDGMNSFNWGGVDALEGNDS